MDVFDEAAEGGEATAGLAAKEAKDAADKFTASAEESVPASEDTLSAAGGKAEETVTAAFENAMADVDAVEKEIEGLEQQTKDSATEAQAVVEEKVAEGIEEVKTASESRTEEL